MKQEEYTIGNENKQALNRLRGIKKCATDNWILILISICSAVIVILVILFTVVSIQDDHALSSACNTFCGVSTTAEKITTYSSLYCKCSGTTIKCSGVSDTAQIEDDLSNMSDCSAATLLITESKFKTIPSYFLNESSLPFQVIRIETGSLSEIEDDAFNSGTFHDLHGLYIINNPIVYLRKNSLRGLNSLDTFSLQMSRITIVSFEKNFLEYINTIGVLQLHNCKLAPEALLNLTGSDVTLSALYNIDLRHNSIPTIPSGAFAQLRVVQLFYINSAEVETVEINAFQGMNKVIAIYLMANYISTLPEGVFSNLNSLGAVYIHDNRWHCDCYLVWLLDLYIKGEIVKNSTPSKCKNHNYMEFSEVDFCPTTSTEANTGEEEQITTTTTTTTPTTTIKTTATDNLASTTEVNDPDNGTSIEATTSTSTSSTTAVSSEVITTTELISTTPNADDSKKEIICRDWARSPIALAANYGDEIFTHTIYINSEKFLFTFYDPDEDPVKIIVTITGNLKGFHLLCFNIYNITDGGCVSNMDNTIALSELKRTNSYTFCMLYANETTVSPFDCFGFEIRVEFAERAWIKNKYSKPITILVIVAFVLAILLSALAMYCCVRRYPVLIKGNQRVVIVGRRKPEESTRPREYDKPAYIPPSFESMLSANPQSNYGYTRVRRRHYRSPMLRSHSEHSIFSNEVAYIRPTGPTSYQLNTWRLGTRNGQPYVDTFEETVYGPKPPPLPPPNNINLGWEENLYTTL